jgi:hypothetical protein
VEKIERQDQPFEHRLAEEPRAAGPERETDRVFAAAFGATRHQQIRDVRARDQQQQQGSRLPDPDERSGAGIAHPLREREDLADAIAVGIGMVAALRLDDRRQFRAGLLERLAIAEPPIDTENLRTAIGPLLVRQRGGRPHFSAVGCVETRRSDAHDLIRLAVEPDLLADDRGIGCEAAAPQAVAKNDAVVLSGLSLALGEFAPHDWRHVEEREETRRDEEARDLLRDVHARQVGVPPPIGRPTADSLRLFLPLTKIRSRHVETIEKGIPRRHRGHDDQSIDAGEPKRPQHERIEQAEGRAVDGEGERERQDDGPGEHRALRGRAPGVEQVACESGPPWTIRLRLRDRDPSHRRLPPQQAREAVAHRDAQALAQVPAAGLAGTDPPRIARRLFAEVADDGLALFRIADDERQYAFCELHDRSRSDSSPLVRLLSDSCVARIAFMPAGVTE